MQNWVIRSAIGGITAYFLGAWVLQFIKFTFWPIFFSLFFSGVYDRMTGRKALDDAFVAQKAEQIKLVRLVDANFYPAADKYHRIERGWLKIENASSGEASDFTPFCHYENPEGGLDERGNLAPKDVHFKAETARVILAPGETRIVDFALAWHGDLRRREDFPKFECKLHIGTWRPKYEVEQE